MKLSKYSAVQIVRELGSVIDQHVNIMDNEGYIIASTDESRVGSFHEAAKKVIDEKLDELVIMDEFRYIGAKKGINYPVVFEDKIVGVVGITGEYEKVAFLGQIIKKMAEILLRDDHHQKMLRRNEQARRQYLEEWLYSEEPVDEQFAAKGLRMGIDINLPRRILLATVRRQVPLTDTMHLQDEMEQIEKIINDVLLTDSAAFVLTRRNRYIIAVSEQGNKRLWVLFDMIQSYVLKQCGVTLISGADSKAACGRQARDSCRSAEEALKATHSNKNADLSFYDEIALEIVLCEIPAQVKEQYINKLFGSCEEEERAAWMRLLEVYFNCNGSIIHTSERLFMHKNTLQYKLRKLRDITGYDPRELIGASCLYMALQFFGIPSE